MRKLVIFLGVLLALLTSPVWIFTAWNSLTAIFLEHDLRGVALPSHAKILSSTSRVYNSGNGDRCDYEALAIVEFYGAVAALQSAYTGLLEDEILSSNQGDLFVSQSNSAASWGAKIVGGFTELYIQPNADHSSRYLISLRRYPRSVSPDFRCW